MHKQAEPLADKLILSLDHALRTLTGNLPAHRANPAAAVADIAMAADESAHSAGLMRVNHVGEVCAQALYEGQALMAKDQASRALLLDAAQEEQDHLAWCRDRLEELVEKPSVLAPLFYAASFAMGAASGALGDRISLGFVEATEDQVVKHLDEHLESLPAEDAKSRAILEHMRADEKRHGEAALQQGGVAFPRGVKTAMAGLAKLMTRTTYRI